MIPLASAQIWRTGMRNGITKQEDAGCATDIRAVWVNVEDCLQTLAHASRKGVGYGDARI